MAPKITLYSFLPSQNAVRPELALLETGIGAVLDQYARTRHGVYGATSAPVQGPVPPRRASEGGGAVRHAAHSEPPMELHRFAHGAPGD